MAVYTDVDDESLRAFLSAYDVGTLLSCKGIAEGVENSNYLVHTTAGFFILTLYEKRVNPDDLPFFVGLMQHVADKGVACAAPVVRRDGMTLSTLCERPAALITFLDGVSVNRPQAHHCAQLGQALARFHLASADYTLNRANTLSLNGWTALASQVPAEANTVFNGLATRMTTQLERITAQWPDNNVALPRGIIHADLFPDNVFFIGDNISGLIDFYFACTDWLAYDVAICLNAWCFEKDGAFNLTKGQAFLYGYHQIRPFTPDEHKHFNVLCQGAALRFLLTRLVDWFNVPEGALVKRKDPLEYDRRLRFHARVTSPSAYGWPEGT
jgi:homoserine kinase type II